MSHHNEVLSLHGQAHREGGLRGGHAFHFPPEYHGRQEIDVLEGHLFGANPGIDGKRGRGGIIN